MIMVDIIIVVLLVENDVIFDILLYDIYKEVKFEI